MKISYSNYPILEKLQKGSLGRMPIFEKDKLYFDLYSEGFVDNWKFYRKNFLHDINVVSKPFHEASQKAESKLIQLWGDITSNDTSDLNVKGTYLFGDFVYMIDYEVRKGNDSHEMAFYIFDKKGIPLCVFVDSAKREIFQNGWISTCFEVKNEPAQIQNWITLHIAKIVIVSMFKTYAEVETKFLPAGKKVKDSTGKYVNDTKLNITYLDSKWFTTLVKSDGFNVRGHFRLQPHGEGLKERKLIWINEFQKSGYTAPARKLSSENWDRVE